MTLAEARKQNLDCFFFPNAEERTAFLERLHRTTGREVGAFEEQAYVGEHTFTLYIGTVTKRPGQHTFTRGESNGTGTW